MRRWLLTGAWFLFLAIIVFLADSFRARAFFEWVQRTPGGDKAGHFFLIGLLAFFLNVSLRCRTFRFAGRDWLLGGAIVLGLAAAEECSQLRLPHRTFSAGDFAADLAGIWAFGWLARAILRRPEQL
jgi:polysaccharide biosynthesis protein VpsQ